MARKKRIGILYGGRSVEHAVSIRSAANVFKYIDREKFDPYVVGITRSGSWYLNASPIEDISTGTPVTIQLAPVIRLFAGNEELKFDIVFPLLHGTNGEDGSIQGLLQALALPCVGSGVLGSAVNMSKLTTKKILQQKNVPVTPFESFHSSERDRIHYEDLVSRLGLPFIIKPANLGSSVGVHKVGEEQAFADALEDAYRYDHTLLFEKFIQGKEVECAVMGNTKPQASAPGEIVISSSYSFYDFRAKYVDEKAVDIQVPARLSEEIIQRVKELSLEAYTSLECRDYARVDLFISDEGEVFVNEINTIPGFTDASMFPMMWAAEGISFSELITRLTDLAFERYRLLNQVETDYFSELDS